MNPSRIVLGMGIVLLAFGCAEQLTSDETPESDADPVRACRLSRRCDAGAGGGAEASIGTDASTGTDASGGGNTGQACALPNYPDATCTGVPIGAVLQRVPQDVTSGPGWTWNAADGFLSVDTAGAVVDGKEVNGCILVNAPGVVVKNSKAQCIGTVGSARSTGGARLTVQDTEIVCTDTDGSTGIGDINFNALRVNIHGCENGFDADSDITIRDSYIHDLHQSVIAHTDGLQSAIGSNIVIDHNRIYAETPGACAGLTDCGGTSAININNRAGGPTTTDTTISNNLLAGGAYTMYCPIPQTVNMRIYGNHFSRLFYPNGGAYGAHTDCLQDDGTPRVAQWTGNVWDDTGLPVGP